MPNLTAVLPLPWTSHAKPNRGATSFQFGTSGVASKCRRRHERPAPTSRALDRPVEVLETHAGIDGEAAERPGILHVDALVRFIICSESCGVLWMITCAGDAGAIELNQVRDLAPLPEEVAVSRTECPP